MHNEYHLSWFGPCLPHWPRGGWSLYHISGDQIAKRVQFGPDGEAIRRDSWCGYIGIFENIEDAAQEITKHKRDHDEMQSR